MASQSYYNQDQQNPLQQYPQQPQQYSQQPPNYEANKPAVAEPNYGKQSYEQTFKIDRPKYNDLWAGILLILTFLGFVAVSGISLRGYAAGPGNGGIYDGANSLSLNSNTMALFGFVLIVSFLLSYGYLLLARYLTKQLIWVTGILNIVFGFGTAIYYLYRHYWSAGVVFLLFAVFTLICFISWIPRIPFSVVMLQTTINVARGFGHVFLTSFIGGCISLLFSAWFSVTLTAVYIKYQPRSSGCGTSGGAACSNAAVIGLLVFVTFAGYWISEWLKNTIYSVVAGVFGSWYFCGGKAHAMPTGVTRGALRRAMTYSFGSISFGSLVVALINLLRQAVSVAQQTEAAGGNTVGAILYCLLGCVISIIDWIVQFVNRFAFSHISLYGKAYIPAAKDTLRMLRDRGIDALVNDCLIGPVLSMGATFVGFACALLAFLYLEFTAPAYNADGGYTPVFMAFAFLIGLQMCQTFTTPLGSGVDTLFVAMAWDPDAMVREHPDFYQQLIAVYPKVQERIHA